MEIGQQIKLFLMRGHFISSRFYFAATAGAFSSNSGHRPRSFHFGTTFDLGERFSSLLNIAVPQFQYRSSFVAGTFLQIGKIIFLARFIRLL